MRRRHRLAILCVGAVASTCVASSATAASIGFRVVAYGASNGGMFSPQEPFARIVRDAQAARALLPVLDMDRSFSHDAGADGVLSRVADVDFRRRSLVAVVGSWQGTPGYSVLLGKVDVTGPTMRVTTTVFSRPGGEADVTARPWTIVSVPRAAVAPAGPQVTVRERCAPGVRCHWPS